MRKIRQKYLFRAKYEMSDVWVYGGGVWQFPEGCKMISADHHGEIIIKDVKPETVGQYLKIKDCKGKRLFEGDIISIEGFEEEFLVEDSPGYISVFDLKNKVRSMFNPNERFEIVGNSIDKPKPKRRARP